MLELKCVRTSENAVIPTRAHLTDSGYDLTIIEKVKSENGVDFFNTGIKIQPTPGWWLMLVPRSSISKTGYMLANSIGIIDQDYTGNILVALRKINPDAADIALPAKLVQIIPMPVVCFDIVETDAIHSTERGEGGFGSSDAK